MSILFADVSGSTGLQERLDPETTRGVMDGVHALLRHAVESHGGRVVKFTGDGAMAVFGIPVLREDDAVRAVRAGATMQADFAAMADVVHRDHGVAIGLRVGANTGEVVVALGSDDVVGDPVNVASRLEAAAGVGEVLMGEQTYRLVRDVLKVETVEPLRLRGKSELVGAARLVSVNGIGPASVTPLVGRDADLATLTAAFEDTVSASECRLVTVLGAPGLGKSRLGAELAAGLGDRARLVVVRFIPDGGSSLGPLVEALRSFVEDAAFLAGLDDGRAVGETLGALLAGGVSGSTEQVFWAFRRLLQGLAVDRPVLLLLDDLHWAEPTMLDLIEHLVAWLRDGPILLLVLARPELSDLRPELVESTGPARAIVVLEALDDSACRRLARDILEADEVPEPVLARALESSEGNPLFLRELLRLLVDDGVLSRLSGGWTATVDVDAIELPATLHAALAARIEQLEPDTREVLQAASVIGRHFARGAVVALLPPAVGASLDEHLGILHRRGLVDPEGTWWVDERLYRFHHALIRDAAYRRVLKRVRAELHERYADWLGARLGDATGEHDQVLGWHLEQAHMYLLELGEATDLTLMGRAAGYLAAAGRRALERDDVGSAANLLGRALRLCPGDTDLMRDRCEALICHGDTATASEVVVALVAAASEERSVAVAEVFDAQLAGLRDPGALQDTARRSAEAARVFARCGDEVGAAKAESVQAVALAGLGQMAACEAALDRSLAAARRAGNQRLANVVLGIAPLAALWGPSPVARASGRCLDVIRVLHITAWAPQVEAQALRCQAVLEAMRDRPEAARRMLDDARTLFLTVGSRLGLLETALHAGQVELFAGAPAVAEAHLRDAIAGFTTLGVRVAAARATALLARALLDLGRIEEAEAIADPSQGGDDLKAAIGLLGVRAEALARRGDIAEAEVLARRAVELAEPTDALVDHADARLGLARVLAAAGRGMESVAELSRAQKLYEAKGCLVGARQTGLIPQSEAQKTPLTAAPEVRPNTASELFEQYHLRLNSGLLPDESICAPVFLVEDHVTHLIEDLASIRATRADVIDGTSGWRFGGEVVATLGERCAVYLERFSSDADRRGASSAEDSRLLVLALDDTGRFDRCHVFDSADYEPAMAVLHHLHALKEGPRRVVQHNHATMCLARWAAAMRTGDTNAVLAAHAPDYINVHHRMQDTLTLDQQRDTELDVAGHAMVEVQALASLGERHALHRVHMGWAYDSLGNVVGPADGEAGEVAYDLLLVSRTDHTGANVRTDMFEAEHLAEAIACLLQRWAEDELTGDARRRALQSAAGSFAEAINRRDWDAYRAQFADDVVLIDHTPVSAGKIGGSEAVTDWTRQFVEAADGTQVLLVDVLAFTPDAALVRSVVSGSLQGGPLDLAWDIAARFGPDGRFDRLEFFYEDESAAWDAFEEMDGHNSSNSGQEQEACRWMRRWSEAVQDRDLDALAALYGSEAVVEDHRPLMQEVLQGPAENLSNVAAVLDLGGGGVGFESEVLAVREHRLGLFRNRFVLEAGEVDILFVAQVEDGTGVLERGAVYGPADTEAAYRTLEEYREALSRGG